MLLTTLLHPEISAALGSAGHGSTVLISDGNFPHATATNPTAARVHLNLAPGVVTVSQVLDVILSAIPVERALLMTPGDGAAAPAHDDLRRRLPPHAGLDLASRAEFYERCRDPDLALVVATGDERTWANVLLTIGVRAAASPGTATG